MKLSEIKKLMNALPPENMDWQVKKGQELLQKLGFEPGAMYQELEMESRFVDTHQDVSFSATKVNLHSHSFYELLFCRNTCGVEYLVGADRYRLQKGDIILIAPGISHCPLLPETMPEPYKRDVLWINAEFMDSVLQYFPEFHLDSPHYSSLLRTGGTHWEALGDLFHTGVWEAETKRPGWEMALTGNTLHLLSLLHRAFIDHSTAPLKAEKPELLDRVLAYVEIHLSEKITLADVSHLFYVSESTISQTFRKKLGVSFYRCVTQRRLIAAKALIEEGRILEQVADLVGFSDYSSFYRAFKQEYGISPRQYKKLQESPESGL